MSGFEKLVRAKAYELWERAGRPEGRGDEFWHAAKRELEAGASALEELENSVDPTAEAPPAADATAASAKSGPVPRRRRTAKGG
jgi:hypothetical protein